MGLVDETFQKRWCEIIVYILSAYCSRVLSPLYNYNTVWPANFVMYGINLHGVVV
jgi:hypothetical protein